MTTGYDWRAGITDPTAVNWSGDVAGLSDQELEGRTRALATAACRARRPWSGSEEGDRVNEPWADEVLDRWAECRDELMKRL